MINRLTFIQIPQLLPGFLYLLCFLTGLLLTNASYRPLPDLPLIALYYWVVYRPDLLPMSFICALGFMQDSFVGLPLGFNALGIIWAYTLITTQRRFFIDKNFVVVWTGFGFITSLVYLFKWALLTFLNGNYLDCIPIFFQVFFTIIFYPLFARFFIWPHRVTNI